MSCVRYEECISLKKCWGLLGGTEGSARPKSGAVRLVRTTSRAESKPGPNQSCVCGCGERDSSVSQLGEVLWCSAHRSNSKPEKEKKSALQRPGCGDMQKTSVTAVTFHAVLSRTHSSFPCYVANRWAHRSPAASPQQPGPAGVAATGSPPPAARRMAPRGPPAASASCHLAAAPPFCRVPAVVQRRALKSNEK